MGSQNFAVQWTFVSSDPLLKSSDMWDKLAWERYSSVKQEFAEGQHGSAPLSENFADVCQGLAYEREKHRLLKLDLWGTAVAAFLESTAKKKNYAKEKK